MEETRERREGGKERKGEERGGEERFAEVAQVCPSAARRVIELSSRALLVVQGGFRGKALFSAANALFQAGTMAGCVAQRG